MIRRLRLATACLPFLLTACDERAQAIMAVDLAGGIHAPLEGQGDGLRVLVFTSHECPIANALAPTLRELAEHQRGRAVSFFVIHVDPDLTRQQAAKHARDYELPGTVLLDPHHDLVRHLRVRRTPEALVFAHGEVQYRGAIDDQWNAPGARAQQASHHYLRDAIEAVLAGRKPDPVDVPPPGCLLPEPKAR